MEKKLKGLNPKVYRRAAKNIKSHSQWYSCSAVKFSARYHCEDWEKHRDTYADLFFPPREIHKGRMCKWDAWGYLWGKTDQEREDCRVLALLFMAEIAKGE